jgi:predicted HD superfamily hydrolase involved in NAD metabolism
MQNLSQIKSKLKKILDRDRYTHSLRVMGMAGVLARRYGVVEKKAALAGLLHDCVRFASPQEFLSLARKFALKTSALQKENPKLLHAPLSAKFATAHFGISDRVVLRAIALHTLGATRMSRLDKIIYLADHIEDCRNYRGVGRIRSLAFVNMDKAIAEVAAATIKYLRAKKLPIDPQTVLTMKAHSKNRCI